MRLLTLFVLTFSALSLFADEYRGQVPDGHVLLFSVHGGNYVTIADRSGKTLWRNSEKLKHPQMLEPLENGQLLVGDVSGAIRMDAGGKIVWQRPVPKGAQNCLATILPNGNLLTGLEGPAKFIEVNDDGEVVFELQLRPTAEKVHGQFRYPTVSPEGTYLVPLLASKTFHEYDRSGEVLWEMTGLNKVTYGLRLENGHTLLCYEGRVEEYDANRKMVWSFDLVADGKLPKTPVINCVPLPGGNLLCSLYQGREDQPDLIEISRNKQIVQRWTFPEHKRVAHVSVHPRTQPFISAALAGE
jgi:hypothetical protein